MIESIKVAGLVLVIDTSEEKGPSRATAAAAAPSSASISVAVPTATTTTSQQSLYRMPDGVDGILKGNGVLRFHDTIDM